MTEKKFNLIKDIACAMIGNPTLTAIWLERGFSDSQIGEIVAESSLSIANQILQVQTVGEKECQEKDS